ncbi:MAG: ribosome assembly cofactor RimP [Flavobacteriaceae bacterium]|jgi:ribosome maturation factor RimP
MDLTSKVRQLLEVALENYPELFLIDLKVGSDNSIRVVLDGDHGVSLQDCINVSRAVEHQLDREEEDFSLEVASVGVGTPLQNARQFIKNIGRKLKVEVLGNPPIQGTLIAADQKVFTVTWKQREPKPVGKGKITVEKKETLSYEHIANAKVII